MKSLAHVLLMVLVVMSCMEARAQKRKSFFGKRYLLSVQRDFYVIKSNGYGETVRPSLINAVRFEWLRPRSTLLGVSYTRNQYKMDFKEYGAEHSYGVNSQAFTFHLKQYMNPLPIKWYFGFNIGYRRSSIKALKDIYSPPYMTIDVRKGETIQRYHVQGGFDFGRTLVIARRIFINLGFKNYMNMDFLELHYDSATSEYGNLIVDIHGFEPYASLGVAF